MVRLIDAACASASGPPCLRSSLSGKSSLRSPWPTRRNTAKSHSQAPMRPTQGSFIPTMRCMRERADSVTRAQFASAAALHAEGRPRQQPSCIAHVSFLSSGAKHSISATMERRSAEPQLTHACASESLPRSRVHPAAPLARCFPLIPASSRRCIRQSPSGSSNR